MGMLHRILHHEDWGVAGDILGTLSSEPDLTISGEDGRPYLHRWYVIPRNKEANVYFHVQVASDPERPLHDHPWDSQSVILSGGYLEVIQRAPPFGLVTREQRHKGQVITRGAEEAHRLILPDGVPYTMTLFTTGPVVRDWGFWVPNHSGAAKWFSAHDCITHEAGVSRFRDLSNLRTPDHA